MNKQSTKQKISLAVRVDDTYPHHHLWNNNGTWWCHFTVHLNGYQKKRIRLSLQTTKVKEAMRKRDQLFASISKEQPIAA